MKIKPIIAGVALSVLTLSACDEYSTLTNRYMPNMTASEQAIILAYKNANSSYTDDGLADFYNPLFRAYSDTKSKSNFFCDHVNELRFSEYALQKSSDEHKNIITISDVITSSMKMSLEDVCNAEQGKIVAPTVQSKNDYKVQTEETTYQLSSQLYDELIIAVHDCKRAEYASMQTIAPDDKLTKEKYDAVVQIVMSCKKFKLEQAIQAK